MAEQQRGFVNLHCPHGCGSVRFTQSVHLRHRPGSGLVPDPAGWSCVTCGKEVDPGAALRAHAVAEKRAELAQLEEELGTLSGMPLSVAVDGGS